MKTQCDELTLLTRRATLLTGVTGLLLAGCGGSSSRSRQDAGMPPVASSTPPSGPSTRPPEPPKPPPAVCGVTAPNIEGPFFKLGAPLRSRLGKQQTRAKMGSWIPGDWLALSGAVMDTNCQPISGARLEFWQANETGVYDNAGFDFRAAMLSAKHGRYHLDTILPGRYLNGARYRPSHVHVKVAASGYRPLTTQLYFEGDPYNEGDPFIHRSLIVQPQDTSAGFKAANFNFVLQRG